MKYQLVYKEHDDKFGNWLVCNERGEYAGATTSRVAGAKLRHWLRSEDAVKYMQQSASVDVSFVWLSEPTVCQGKPGATSMQHKLATAASYKPSHGGYPAAPAAPVVQPAPAPVPADVPKPVNPARKSAAVWPTIPTRPESNEEASTVPQALVDSITTNLRKTRFIALFSRKV